MRRLALRCLALAALAGMSSGASAQDAVYGAAYVGVVEPDDAPVLAAFFPAGGPLQRHTGRPDAWYAVLQMPMVPGQAYGLFVTAPNDGSQVQVSAFDDDPYLNPGMRADLSLRTLGPRTRRSTTYVATLRTPANSTAPGAWLLVEWVPGARRPSAPPAVRLQAFAVHSSANAARNPRWGTAGARADTVVSPLSGAVQELPMPSMVEPARR